MNKEKRVLLGMSGGVDSSVSAILLKEQGYEVIGVTMKLLHGEIEGSCCNLDATYDAKRVCDYLKMPHYTIDFCKEFKEYVIDNFINSYKEAKTPNPCIECNKYLKFGKMFELAKELECNFIATGHYAKVEFDKKYNRYVLKKSDSIKKDQSYVLYSIDKEILPYVLFPLSKYEDKEEIRKIARDHGLKIASKPDSEDICFIPNNNYVGFLTTYGKLKLKQGDIVLKDGTKLGKHDGYIKYTIGQRRGLNISYKEPLYVNKIDKKKNEVIVGPENEIFTDTLVASDLNFLAIDKLEAPLKVKAKVRYAAKEADATLIPIDETKVKVVFDENQRAITKGQSVVFYDNDIVIGGGKIL